MNHSAAPSLTLFESLQSNSHATQTKIQQSAFLFCMAQNGYKTDSFVMYHAVWLSPIQFFTHIVQGEIKNADRSQHFKIF